jgi:hypothetical protein
MEIYLHLFACVYSQIETTLHVKILSNLILTTFDILTFYSPQNTLPTPG